MLLQTLYQEARKTIKYWTLRFHFEVKYQDISIYKTRKFINNDYNVIAFFINFPKRHFCILVDLSFFVHFLFSKYLFVWLHQV